ncbi:MAG TPA: exopolysaccharide biosynthesis polyprenyl glycosylphosphotransferase [Gemmatimonadales bacterium]|nr:exopolysaccharide biosynthesis polyprenyl glycosylphosphotransferase [Gemmatimonadales bacterium]
MESLPLERSSTVAAESTLRLSAVPAAPNFRTRLLPADLAIRARLQLQERAPANLRRHLARALGRVIVLAVADLSALWVVRAMLKLIRDYDVLGVQIANLTGGLFPRGIMSGVQFAIALVAALVVTGNYGPGDQRRDARRLFVAAALAAALPLWMTLWTRGLGSVLFQYIVMMLFVWVALVAERFPIDKLAARVLPHAPRIRTLFVGTREACAAVMTAPTFGRLGEFRILGFVDAAQIGHPSALGSIADFASVLESTGAETVVICGYLNDAMFHDVVDASVAAGTQILSVPRSIRVAGVAPLMVWRDGQPLIELSRPALKSRQMFFKRMLDLTASAVGLVVLSPLLGLVALAVKLDSKGPALFGHERLGLNGRPFTCYKFRSMHVDAGQRLRFDPALYAEYVANHYKLPEERDPRLTRVGRLLRKTSIDELPQLFNVLRGDMSLVGPRPIVKEEIDEYGHGAPAFLSLKPGITGAWQIQGRSNVGYPVRANMELEYVRNWSLGRDLWILLNTVPAVLLQRGAH